MINVTSNIIKGSFILFMFTNMASCSTTSNISPTPTIIASPVNPLETSTPYSSNISAPPTFTQVLTETPIAPLQTLTPLPTLSVSTSKKKVVELLRTNGGCRLPCWWGITPGKTSWNDTESFLATFAQSILVEQSNETTQIAEIKFPTPIDVSYITYLDQLYNIENGIVDTIKTYNYELADWYYLPNILKEYGQPEEVYIFTYKNEFNNSRPTGIILFYPSQGIMIEYVGQKKVENVGDKVRVCPGGTYNFMYLWSPEKLLTFEEAAKRFLDSSSLPFPKPLQQASDMDVKTFYETYKNPNASKCFETPAEIWPVY